MKIRAEFDLSNESDRKELDIYEKSKDMRDFIEKLNEELLHIRMNSYRINAEDFCEVICDLLKIYGLPDESYTHNEKQNKIRNS